jgi:hypothetical protein
MQPSLRIANLDARWALTNGMVWSPFVRAAWVHEFRPDRSDQQLVRVGARHVVPGRRRTCLGREALKILAARAQ